MRVNTLATSLSQLSSVVTRGNTGGSVAAVGGAVAVEVKGDRRERFDGLRGVGVVLHGDQLVHS